MQTGFSGTLIGWISGQTNFVPLWDRMEGAWLRNLIFTEPHSAWAQYKKKVRSKRDSNFKVENSQSLKDLVGWLQIGMNCLLENPKRQSLQNVEEVSLNP
jgi:hypothetical protein